MTLAGLAIYKHFFFFKNTHWVLQYLEYYYLLFFNGVRKKRCIENEIRNNMIYL